MEVSETDAVNEEEYILYSEEELEVLYEKQAERMRRNFAIYMVVVSCFVWEHQYLQRETPWQ